MKRVMGICGGLIDLDAAHAFIGFKNRKIRKKRGRRKVLRPKERGSVGERRVHARESVSFLDRQSHRRFRMKDAHTREIHAEKARSRPN